MEKTYQFIEFFAKKLDFYFLLRICKKSFFGKNFLKIIQKFEKFSL